MGKPFNSRSSTFLMLVHALVIDLEDSDPTVKLLCAPSHVGIEGNEKADVLVKHTGTCRLTTRSVNKIPSSDMILHLHKVLRKAWRHH